MTSRSSLKEIRFTFNGKRYSVYGRTKAEAKEKAAAKKALLEAGVREAKSGYTVDQWSRKWLEEYKSDVSRNWYKAIDGMIRNVISPAIGFKLVRDVKPIDITRMYSSISDKSESYVKKVVFVTRQIFEAAEINDLILKDPTRRVKIPKFNAPPERRTLTAFERGLAIKTARKFPDDGRFFMVMLYCGCRPQEVAVLQRKDFDGDVLHITKARKDDGEIGSPKSKAGIRDIPIPKALKEFIPDVQPDDFVCKNLHGDPLTKTSIRNLWNRFKREMELETGAKTFRNAIVEHVLPDDLTPYCFRHTYCTDLQDAGVPLVVASRLMGHSDIRMTSEIYTHASDSSFEEAKKLLNKDSESRTLWRKF